MLYIRFLSRHVARPLLAGGLLVGIFLLTYGALSPTHTVGYAARAQDSGGGTVIQSEPVVPGEFHGDVRDLPTAPLSVPGEYAPRVTRPPLDPDPSSNLLEQPESPIDPLMERPKMLRGMERTFDPPDLNFQGIPNQGGAPPDTVGEVGANHYIQMTNASVVQIYDKTGALQAGPFLLETLWTAGGVCANGRGDPVVLYDHLADRWLMTEFATGSNDLCVYVSMTGDPIAGGWYNYDFPTPSFPDYPKYAVWPDAYYVSSNESSPAAYALDRTNMLAGLPATSQRFTAPSLAGFAFQALIPSDLDGPAPPAGAPNYFMRHRDDEVHNAGMNDPTQDFLEIWEFDVDFVTPANSTFTQVANIPVAEFDSDLCGLVSFFCFPQPGTSTTLDPLREVIMWRLQYRNFGTHETLVGNFVTDVTGTDQGGIRWFELRRTPPGAGTWTLFQEGTHSPDTDSRWMGSIAMDQAGGIALGYSVSSGTTFPSITYTGRLAGDPLGTMPLGEVTAVAGLFSQTGTTRWGDYSSMNVDPIDGCTFWYTNEYVGDNLANNFGGTGNWTTQIIRFDLPGCINNPPVAACQNVTAEVDPLPSHACAASTASVDNGSFDPDGDPITLAQSPPAPYNLGSTPVTLTVTDDGGLADICTATVTVVDITPPELTAPPDVGPIECTSPGGTPANLGVATADDSCAFTLVDDAPALFPLGTTTVTYTATDGSGNVTSATQDVTIEDTTSPVVMCNNPSTIVPPDAPVSFTATATDTCEGDLTPVITAFDCFKFTKKGKRIDKTGSCAVSISGDIITILDSGGVDDHITWTAVATDGSGNVTTEQCEVLVVKP